MLPDRTADSFFIDRCASLHIEVAFLHYTNGIVPDTVAQLTRSLFIPLYLHAIGVVVTFNLTAKVGGGSCQTGGGYLNTSKKPLLNDVMQIWLKIDLLLPYTPC